jgi:hypothetical protein
MKRKLCRAVIAVLLLMVGFSGGYYAARRDLVSRFFHPSTEAARSRVQSFIQARLEASPGDSTSDAPFCTAELGQLIELDAARVDAFYEGYEKVKPDPGDKLKGPVEWGDYFICVTQEGKMSVQAAQPIRHGEVLEIPLTFTSEVGGHTYDQGKQTAMVRLESGDWRIADIIDSDGLSLLRNLRRPKVLTSMKEASTTRDRSTNQPR